MADFAKTSTGYFNVDAVAFITQQVGGAYRIRFTDGMVQVISKDDGDAVMRVIGEPTGNLNEDAKPKRKTSTKKTA